MSEATAAPAVEQPAQSAPQAEQPATLLSSADPKPADAAPAADVAPKDGGDSTANAAEGEAKPEESAKPNAPEKYEFKAPEGVTALDSEVLGTFEAVARELDLPQDKAQSVVDKLAPKIQERMQAAQLEALAAASSQWVESVKTDKEIGGDGMKENMAAAARFRDAFATPELRKLLDESHLGNHPEVVRLFVRAGKALGSDSSFLTGKATVRGDDARSIYAKSNMNP